MHRLRDLILWVAAFQQLCDCRAESRPRFGGNYFHRQSTAAFLPPHSFPSKSDCETPHHKCFPQQALLLIRTTESTSSALHMALVPLAVNDLDDLLRVSGAPTGDQTAAYWGRTQQERYGRMFESSTMTILGVTFSYFLSFVLGGFVATLLGTVFLFWSVFSPQLQAYQRNWEFRGGRDIVDPWIAQETISYSSTSREFEDGDELDEDELENSRLGLYGALFLGRIDDVCVVEEVSAPPSEEFDLEDFADYQMEEDELEKWSGIPYLIRIKVQDDDDRTLQVHARLSEEYVDLEPGLPVLGVMLSTSPRFTKLAALTDLFVPDLECWIGDYPYLDRAGTEQLLAGDDEIWDLLQAQRLEEGNTNVPDS